MKNKVAVDPLESGFLVEDIEQDADAGVGVGVGVVRHHLAPEASSVKKKK